MQEETTDFTGKLLAIQPLLHSFVLSALPGYPDQVADVVQNINVALLRRTNDYDSAKPFTPWAIAFAKNQIRDFLGRQRKNHLIFNSDTLDVLANLYAAPEPKLSRYCADDLEHLEVCKQRLKESQRTLLALRYDLDLPIRDIAHKLGNNETNIRANLSYTRKLLADCMKRLCELAAHGPVAEVPPPMDTVDRLTENLIEEGEVPPEKANVLQGILHNSEERLRVFDALEVHALLKWRLASPQEAVATPLPDSGRTRLSGWYPVAAAAAALVILSGFVWAVRHADSVSPSGSDLSEKVVSRTEASGAGERVVVPVSSCPAVTNRPEVIQVAVNRERGVQMPIPVYPSVAENSSRAARTVVKMQSSKTLSKMIGKGEKTMNVTKTVAATVAAAVVAAPLIPKTASATELSGLIDLAGTNATLVSLTGGGIITNSSDTVSTLTLTTDTGVESVFAGSIVGTNIDVILTGSGTEYFTGTNTYRNASVTGCALKFNNASNLCSGTLTLNDGSTFYPTASYTTSHAPYVTVASGATSVFRADDGVTISLCPKNGAYLNFTSATIDKIGAGTMNLAENWFSGGRVAGGTLIVDEGTMTINQNEPFGPYSLCWGNGMTIQINEGGRVVCSTHTAFNNVTLVLRGGTLESIAASSINNSFGVFSDLSIASWGYSWFGMAFGQNVVALASSNGAPSVITGSRLSLANVLYGTTFDVAEGAELQLIGPLFPGYVSEGVYKTGQGFTKTGTGMLTLSGCCNADGILDLEEGTLNLSNGMSYATAMTLHAAAGTQVSLSDSSYLGASVGGGILKEADVWMDPSELTCTNGEKVTSVANKGQAGGNFGLFTAGTIPDAAIYTTNAIHGLGCLEFYGTNGLLLTSFANSSRFLSVFIVLNRKAVTRAPYTSNCCWWGGPLSMNLYDTGSGDNEQAGSFHYEYGGTANGVNVHFGPTGAGYLDLGVGLNNFCLIETFADAKLGKAPSRKYVSDSSTGTSSIEFTPYNEKSFRFDRIAIGGRLDGNGKAKYTNGEWDQMFIGQIGELLIYSRSLSSDEIAQIEAYLQRKWFGSETSADASSNAVSYATVNVPAGATATLEGDFGEGGAVGYGSLVKTGAGTLNFHGAVDTGMVEVVAGRLALGDTSRVSRADIWVDASDLDSYTLEADAAHVASIANKGFCGGAFTKNTFNGDSTTDGQPTYEAGGINRLPCLAVNGHQGLMFLGYTNNLDYLSLNVYCVLRRTGFLSAGWGGPFSMSHVSATGNDNATAGHFHMEQGNAYDADFNFFVGEKKVALKQTLGEPSSNSTPCIIVSHANYSAMHNMIITNTNPDSAYVLMSKYDYGTAYPLNIDIIELGCRLGSGGKAQTNYGFVGEIGEFIVFTHPLTVKEETELVGYLKKKWFDSGDGTVTPPTFLTGATALTTTFGAGTQLVLDGGAELYDALATQPLSSLDIGENAKLIRDGVSNPLSFAFFTVTGEVSLPAKIALMVNTAPTDNATLLTYGSLASAYATTWSLSGQKSDTARVYNKSDQHQLIFSLSNGSRVILR